MSKENAAVENTTKKPEQPPVSKSLQRARNKASNKYIIKLTVTLLGICAVVALLLGIVNSVTKPVITKMKEEKTQAAMAQVLEAKHYVKAAESEWRMGEVENLTALYQAANDEGYVGYVAEVTASGFGGTISMVVGVDPDGNVTGVAVIGQSETPNIGSKVVTDQSVLDRFVGMSHANGEITANSGNNRFDGVSGATVSSKGVTAGVNTALSAVAQAQAAMAAEG